MTTLDGFDINSYVVKQNIDCSDEMEIFMTSSVFVIRNYGEGELNSRIVYFIESNLKYW